MLAGLETIDSGTLMYNGQELPLEELGKRHLLGFVLGLPAFPAPIRIGKLGSLSYENAKYVAFRGGRQGP